MDYRMGIDIGTSSLGWCCLKMENGKVAGILDLGVRIFPDSRNDKTKDPLCVARRDARSSRRRLKRFRLRQAQLIEYLQASGLLPSDKAEFKNLEKLNPYELRSKALYNKIPLYELGRAIFHLNQRRGFLSNRKEEKDEQSDDDNKQKKSQKKKISKTQMAMNTLWQKIKEKNCQTLGEYLFKTGIYRFKNATDEKGRLKVDENTTYPNRQMYKDEFDKIWEAQKKYYPQILTDELKIKLRDNDIFYQRPLKKQETGFCWLEPDERRCPKAYIAAQQFRIISEVNNLEINYPEKRVLTKEEREKLFAFLNNPLTGIYDGDYVVSFANILNHMNLPENTTFNLMKNKREGLKCNITNAIFGSTENFGKKWYNYSDEKQKEIIDILLDYSLTKEEVKDELMCACTDISQDNLEEVIEQSLFLPDGYMSLSEKALRKLTEEMSFCGCYYAQAVENVYHITGEFAIRSELPPYQELFTEQLIGGNKEIFDKELDYDNYMGRITNVSVHIALNQLRQVVNEIIDKYGNPSGITIELGRELTKGKKALDDIEKKQKENAKINQEAREAIRKLGAKITPFNMEKYKVWRNLNPNKVEERIDLYTGKVIKLSDLFSWDYEIEHILPYSWTYDDSYSNKIITRANINRQKLNQLPYDFFSDENQLKAVAKDSDELQEMQLEKVKERAKDIDKARKNIKKTFNFNAITWRFSKNACDIFNKNSNNMARDLTDMQYMSKLAKKYLTCICPDSCIVSAKGQITDIMKKVWNIYDVMPEDYRLWQPQKWQKDDITARKAKRILQQNPELGDKEATELAKKEVAELSDNEIQNLTSVGKDRSIHYHHALDAFTLANINQGIVQKLSSERFANEVEEYQEKQNRESEKENDYITLSEARMSLLKQSGKFYALPYENFDKQDLTNRLRSIVVSYRNIPDKIKLIMKKSAKTGKNPAHFSFAAITEDTAFGFRKILSIKNGDMDLEFSVRKSGKRVREKHSLSTMVPVFRNKEQKEKFLQLYSEWQKVCVRQKAIGKDEYARIEREFIDSFSKDKAFKWYASAGNYAAQIYQINKNDKYAPNPNEDWSLEILPNYYAFERQGKFFWKDIYPTAKLITTLHINDVVQAIFSADDELEGGFSKIRAWVKEQFRLHSEAEELKLLFRVKKMSGSSIFLRPLHIAQEDNGDLKSWQCSIGKFKQYHCRKVSVTPLGKVIGG